MHRSLVALWFCAVGWAAAPAPVIVDGDLNDALWRGAAWFKMAPVEPGVPADLGGEIRVAVAGRYVYIAARLPEPSGRFTARSMGRNPHWEEEDLLRVVIGSYPDFVVQVGPLGAWSVETKNQPVLRERFFAAARRGEHEWTAEIAVPLNDLKAMRAGDIRMTVERTRAIRPLSAEQHWRWPEHEPSGKLPPGDADAPEPVFRPAPVGNREPAIEAGRGGIPRLDAGWDEEPWRDVPAWKLRRNEPLGRVPAHHTEVKVLHDGASLAVLARCADPAGAGESFDVYLATTGSSYVHFAIGPGGSWRNPLG